MGYADGSCAPVDGQVQACVSHTTLHRRHKSNTKTRPRPRTEAYVARSRWHMVTFTAPPLKAGHSMSIGIGAWNESLSRGCPMVTSSTDATTSTDANTHARRSAGWRTAESQAGPRAGHWRALGTAVCARGCDTHALPSSAMSPASTRGTWPAPTTSLTSLRGQQVHAGSHTQFPTCQPAIADDDVNARACCNCKILEK